MAPVVYDVHSYQRKRNGGYIGTPGRRWKDHTYLFDETVCAHMNSFNKATELLVDTDTYKPIPRDPTSRVKNKLAQIPRNIKTTGGLNDFNYKRLFPTSAVPPSSMGSPNYIKLAPPHAHSLHSGISHLWCGQGAG